MAKGKVTTDTPGDRQQFYFQFITTPTADTPGTALLLHFDNQRYLFGRIAEGLQRACVQRGIGIKKVRNMFLTGSTSWANMGGLLGMILTMADVQHDEIDPTTEKRPKMNIYGGPKLMHTMACARRFIFRTGMPLQIRESWASDDMDEPNYSDQNIDVWTLPVRRRGRSGINSPRLPMGRSQSPNTLEREQAIRADTVNNMFDSDWRKDRLVEYSFDEVKLPALIWTRNPETKELVGTQCTTMADAPNLQSDSRVLVRNPWPASMIEELPRADNIAGSTAISYIVKGKSQRGRFLPQKAKELGVRPGPDFSGLVAGNSVTLENGTVITPDMVLGESEPGKGMAILDVPTDEYIDTLAETLERVPNGAMNGIETASWILGPGVVLNSSFADLIESLPNMQHIISSPDISPNYLALDSASASSIRLAQIRPECFKIPEFNNENLTGQMIPQNIKYISAERGLHIRVAPKWTLTRSEIPPLLDVEETKASYSEILRDIIPEPESLLETAEPYDDVEILALGTGSAVPSKYRNVSATLVRVPNVGSFLFDCGENTIGALRRAYKAEELEEVLADLRMVWISHLHADHHLGLLSIVEAKKRVMQHLGKTEPKLHIVGERHLADYLNDQSSVQSVDHCEILDVLNSNFRRRSNSSDETLTEISQTSLPIKEFLTTRVSHCHGAQACSITFSNGFKFSYSGDCRPSAQFAKIGLGSDVLLHEATFDDGLEGDAMAKKHSTTGEALAVAHAMKAKNVVLTHFSQRYQKIPVLNNVKFGEVRFEESNDTEEAGPIEDNLPSHTVNETPNEPTKVVDLIASDVVDNSNDISETQNVARDMHVCVAFDLMSVKVGQIRDMYKYYPAIEKMFELEQGKSDARRDERREANERLHEEKEEAKRIKMSPRWNPKPQNPTPTKPRGGDLYERINRGRSKASNGADSDNPEVPSSGVDVPASNQGTMTGTQTTANGHAAQPPLSNKARKRLLKQQQEARDRKEAQDHVQDHAVLIESETAVEPAQSNPPLETEPLSRGSSHEVDARQRKRAKTIDDRDAGDVMET